MSINLFDLAMSPDPRDALALLRGADVTEAEIAPGVPLLVVGRPELVRRALSESGSSPSDPFSNAQTLAPILPVSKEVLPLFGQLFNPDDGVLAVTAAGDPPDYPLWRTMRSAFPKGAAELTPLIADILNELIATLVKEMSENEEVDFVHTATWLPLIAIVRLMGVPQEREVEEAKQILAWADGQVDLLFGRPTPERQVELATNLVEFWRYCQRLVERKDLRPDSVTKRLLDKDLRIPHKERAIASFAFNLLVAGHATTRDQILNSLHLLLQHTTRWDDLVTVPSLIKPSIEETLRLDPALPLWMRQTGDAPVTFGEETIPPNTRFGVSIAASGRAAENGGDFFNPFREHERVSAFGHGPHQCLGESLARLELGQLIKRLSEAFPSLYLTADFEPSYHPNAVFRGLTALSATIER